MYVNFAVNLNFKCHCYFRPVTHTDIQLIEKKLLQTLDMILVKKKRIAIAQARDIGVRQQYIQNAEAQGKTGGRSLWNSFIVNFKSFANPHEPTESKDYLFIYV